MILGKVMKSSNLNFKVMALAIQENGLEWIKTRGRETCSINIGKRELLPDLKR